MSSDSIGLWLVRPADMYAFRLRIERGEADGFVTWGRMIDFARGRLDGWGWTNRDAAAQEEDG